MGSTERPDEEGARGLDYTIHLWDPRRPDGNPRVLFVADDHITALAWVPNNQLLVAGDARGRLHWLELGGHQP